MKKLYAPLNKYIDNMIDKHKQGLEIDAEQKEKMTELTNDLIRNVLHGCDACFTTICNANQPKMWRALKSDTFIVQEAAKLMRASGRTWINRATRTHYATNTPE